MDSGDGDLEFVSSLAKKYNDKTIRKKDIYTLGGVILLLACVAFYQTVNAITLQVTNIKLERTLAQYSKPADNQSPVNDLPAPFLAQNVSFDFTKPLPELNAKGNCNQATLEQPPTLLQNKSWEPCVLDKNITFGDSAYTLNELGVFDI